MTETSMTMIQPPINSEKRCRVCDTVFKAFKTTDRFCSYKCASEFQNNQKSSKKPPKRPIRKFSKKRQKENRIYTEKRKEFLSRPENQICFIEGCNKKANTIEHTAGRIGEKFLDETYWKPCCLEHNLELERNPILSKHYQLSKIHDGNKI